MKPRRKCLLSLVIALAVFIVWNRSVEAYEYRVTFRPFYNDLYYVDGSVAYSGDDAYLQGSLIVDSVYKEFGTLSEFSPQIIHDIYGTYRLGFYKDQIERMQNIHQQCQDWCAISMPQIVPDGTSFQNAIQLVADWVADHVTYDYDALTDENLASYYQDALPGFQTGKGICATYATMFDTMISWLPYNDTTQCVDYQSTDAYHVDTKYISNEDHGWSAVLTSDGWYLFDITFYDNNDGERLPQYLYMTADALNDGSHIDPVSRFYLWQNNNIVVR